MAMTSSMDFLHGRDSNITHMTKYRFNAPETYLVPLDMRVIPLYPKARKKGILRSHSTFEPRSLIMSNKNVASRKAYISPVAGFYDWTPGFKVQSLTPADIAANEDIYSVEGGSIFRRAATRSKSGYPSSPNSMGRMFAKIKTNTTKGEKSIINGIHQNRAEDDGQNHKDCKEVIDTNAIMSHKEAWNWDCSKSTQAISAGTSFNNAGLNTSNDIAVATVSPWITHNLAQIDRNAPKSALKTAPSPQNQFIITKKGFRIPPLRAGNGSSYVEKIQKTSILDKDIIWQKTVMDIYLPKAEPAPLSHRDTVNKKNRKKKISSATGSETQESIPDLVMSPVSTISNTTIHFNDEYDEDDVTELCVPIASSPTSSSQSVTTLTGRPCSPTPNQEKKRAYDIPVIISPWVRNEQINHASASGMRNHNTTTKIKEIKLAVGRNTRSNSRSSTVSLAKTKSRNNSACSLHTFSIP